MASAVRAFIRHLSKVTALAVILLASAHLVESRVPNSLESVQASGVLRVASINGPETYYEDTDGKFDGFEFELARAFAKYLGVQLEIVPASNFGELLELTRSGKTVDMAAAGLIITEGRKALVDFSTPYLDISQLLIYRNGTGKPTELEELFGKKIMVMADSGEADRVAVIAAQYPELVWVASSDYNSMDLIEQVHSGETDFAMVKSTAFSISQSVYPRARIAYTFPDKQPMAWAFSPQVDQSLKKAANRFLEEYLSSGKLASLEKSHFEIASKVDTGGALTFSNRVKNRLPKWENLLKEAANTYQIDWMMLAAISYQESHWNPKARSHTGVRGMMMLTLNTARELGIENRLDPAQSIDGGARYITHLLERIPESVQGPDRLWMTLAAYNVGFGHLSDARQLTVEQGGNPDAWDDVAEALPLLAQRKYYKTTRHGYARGWEPVNYVNNIRQYYTILAWHKQVEQRRIAMLDNPPMMSVNEAAPINANPSTSSL
ncbi:membrane-bound lytic murein transglycosylase MltF [Simiduia curdlanivorans]|uniref:Membrane-bound lytic murein transglycosylase F n=1 Tax=Simiduia curdlanivorans TaxID=1492769 RepID=A0ABV8V9Q2_9GAMM|nr:membrane-bound lytic murein transglycosylase MltF [Simiduia curdlanivorans]MDN3639754.1 membrane-bound lytic murein transglycosylase MltF [Simiduia curdlanivorans]